MFKNVPKKLQRDWFCWVKCYLSSQLGLSKVLLLDSSVWRVELSPCQYILWLGANPLKNSQPSGQIGHNNWQFQLFFTLSLYAFFDIRRQQMILPNCRRDQTKAVKITLRVNKPQNSLSRCVHLKKSRNIRNQISLKKRDIFTAVLWGTLVW